MSGFVPGKASAFTRTIGPIVRTNGCLDNGDCTCIFRGVWVKQVIDDMTEDGNMKDGLIPFVSPRVVKPKVRHGKILLPSR
jgi:hypothetical protein